MVVMVVMGGGGGGGGYDVHKLVQEAEVEEVHLWEGGV